MQGTEARHVVARRQIVVIMRVLVLQRRLFVIFVCPDHTDLPGLKSTCLIDTRKMNTNGTHSPCYFFTAHIWTSDKPRRKDEDMP
jgi:hypothetical protein